MLEHQLQTELIASLVNFSDRKADPETIEALTRVIPADFTDETYKQVVTVIKQLWQKGELINSSSILHELRKTHKDDAIRFITYVNSQTKNIVIPRPAFETFLMLREQTVISQLTKVMKLRAERLGAITDPFDELALQNEENDKLHKLLTSVSRATGLKEQCAEVRKDYYERKTKADKGISANEYPLLLTKFDSHLVIERGDLVILAARPGMGKTAFALFYVRKMCRQGKRVLFLSLEMTSKKLIGRMVCGEADISSEHYRAGRLNEKDTEKMNNSLNEIYEWKLNVNDTAPMNINDITGVSMVAAQQGIDLIVIDYMGLIAIPNKDSRNNELGVVSQGLKHLAKRLNVPVIALHQLSRKVEERGNKMPVLSDLRDSGNIEQDADVVMFLYRDAYYTGEGKQEIEIKIAKYREGEANKVITLSHDKDIKNFTEGEYTNVF
jgi:replicative DNA helicase